MTCSAVATCSDCSDCGSVLFWGPHLMLAPEDAEHGCQQDSNDATDCATCRQSCLSSSQICLSLKSTLCQCSMRHFHVRALTRHIPTMATISVPLQAGREMADMLMAS